jgi:hypothetical protein
MNNTAKLISFSFNDVSPNDEEEYYSGEDFNKPNRVKQQVRKARKNKHSVNESKSTKGAY